MNVRIRWDRGNARSPDFVFELTETGDLPFLFEIPTADPLQSGWGGWPHGYQDAVCKVRRSVLGQPIEPIKKFDQPCTVGR